MGGRSTTDGGAVMPLPVGFHPQVVAVAHGRRRPGYWKGRQDPAFSLTRWLSAWWATSRSGKATNSSRSHLSPHDGPAVHADRLAGEVLRRIRGQERGQLGHVAAMWGRLEDHEFLPGKAFASCAPNVTPAGSTSKR